MGELQKLLMRYNLSHHENIDIAPWAKQYCGTIFPKYWEIVYNLLCTFDKNLSIIEIGAGLGDVTAIPCFLGYKKVCSFERDKKMALTAKRKLRDIFQREDIVIDVEFPDDKQYSCDILLLVNCVYADSLDCKEKYVKKIKDYYNSAGAPQYFVWEVIDDSYIMDNAEFPKHIRMSRDDVYKMFPDSKMHIWQTYKFPHNMKSKTLYLIENENSRCHV